MKITYVSHVQSLLPKPKFITMRYSPVKDHWGALQKWSCPRIPRKSQRFARTVWSRSSEIVSSEFDRLPAQHNASKEHLNTLIYSGPEASKQIYLYAHDDHYDVISSMSTFLAGKKYCHLCKGYDKIDDSLRWNLQVINESIKIFIYPRMSLHTCMLFQRTVLQWINFNY